MFPIGIFPVGIFPQGIFPGGVAEQEAPVSTPVVATPQPQFHPSGSLVHDWVRGSDGRLLEIFRQREIQRRKRHDVLALLDFDLYLLIRQSERGVVEQINP